jgi:hypothetical protein
MAINDCIDADGKPCRRFMDEDHDRLVRLDENLHALTKMLIGNGQPGKCGVNEGRISKLEHWRSWVNGALAVITFVIGGLVAFIHIFWQGINVGVSGPGK